VKKIAILASGSGSNAENIANYFAGSDYAEVSFIIANNPNGGKATILYHILYSTNLILFFID
jgi:folate-dependent phosphoribosylglycinamide formyltransferase PurN